MQTKFFGAPLSIVLLVLSGSPAQETLEILRYLII